MAKICKTVQICEKAQTQSSFLSLCLYAFVALCICVCALLFRLPRLAERPMHGDEAVHADKFGDLLEKGDYKYDSYEYHGPTLNYFTLIPAYLLRQKTLVQVNEITLRIVPVFFGALLVLAIFLICDGLGRGPAICSAMLTAISPAMVFFSRYYIQEILLVFFTFAVIAACYRYYHSGSVIWAVLAGVFAGLMHATKETGIIAVMSMLLSLSLLWLWNRRNVTTATTSSKIKPVHILAGLAAFLIVSALFFSSFGQNLPGIVDSIKTYSTYLNRAGNNGIHNHSWYYYLQILLFYKFGTGPIWTEAIIVLLAFVGFIAAMTGRGLPSVNVSFLRFLGLYTLFMTAAYCAIPYKTPWCMLSFFNGMLLLAGFGAVVLLKLLPKKLPQMIVLLLLAGAFAHLAWESYRSNYIYYADSRNPYVYAAPTTEIYTAIDKINYYAAANSRGKRMYIDVIFPEHDYWPLPWYLRAFPNVGYSDHVVGQQGLAPLIIASPQVEPELLEKIYDPAIPFERRQLYVFIFEKPYYIWLRPKVELSGYVRKDLWDAAEQGQIWQDSTSKEIKK
jgi:uncharacterized protein (TIGR03663 family)